MDFVGVAGTVIHDLPRDFGGEIELEGSQVGTEEEHAECSGCHLKACVVEPEAGDCQGGNLEPSSAVKVREELEEVCGG